jgi:hypothetical protein
MMLDLGNGGFPEPPAGEPVRVVRCSHLECGGETRIRLPRHLPTDAVRRVVCDGCGRPYECHLVEELGGGGGAAASTPATGGWLSRPPGRGWRLLSIPIAAAAVIAALLLIRPLQGDDAAVEQADVAGGGSGAGTAEEEARLVREPTYTLALPPGWERTDPPSGATFGARAPDAAADAALYIERDPDLDFPRFEARSLKQLRRTAGSAALVDRVTGPTIEQTVTRLRSDPASGGPAYEVTLRASGPYRYYLLTALQPGAVERARSGARLIHSSFFPGPQ